MNCPSLQRFEDYLSGELSGDELRQFEEHLQSCASCRQALEGEKQLDDLLRSQPLMKAPQGFSRRVMANLTFVEKSSTLPDWLMALALGLIISFTGFMIGKLGLPFLRSLTDKVGTLIANSDILAGLEKVGGFAQSDWFLQLSGGSHLLVLNFIVAGIILCWGLWQMVKALR